MADCFPCSNSDNYGFLFSIAFGVIAAVHFSMSKNLIDSFDPVQITFVRSFVNLFYILPYSSWHETESYTFRDMILYILCGFLNALSWISTTAALYYLEVGDSTSIEFGGAVCFTAIFGHFFLSEKVDKLDLTLLSVDILGVFLISKPNFLFTGKNNPSYAEDRAIGLLLALITALLLSIWPLFLKRLQRNGKLNCLLLGFFMGLWGVPLMLLFSLFFGSWRIPSSLWAWGMLGLYSITCFVQTIILTIAFYLEDAKNVAVSSTISTVLTYVVQLTIFNAPLDWVMFSGAILVTFALILVQLKNYFT